MRTRPAPVHGSTPLALAALVGCFAACNQLFGVSGGDPGGPGGASTSSSDASSSSGEIPSSTAAASSSSTSSSGTSTSGATSGASSSSSSSSGVSLQDCVLLLHMDESSWSGAGSVKDLSGQGNDGTPIGTAHPGAMGKFANAGIFDGSGYVNVPDSSSLEPTTAITYAAWIYPTGLGNDALYPGIISKRVSYTDDVAFTMFIWTGLKLWVDIEAGLRFHSIASFSNNQWYHVAVVFDGAATSVKVYIDGALDTVNGAIASFTPHTADVTVGYLPQGPMDAGAPDPSAFFVGRIDEVAIWKRALTANEIMALYQAKAPL